MHDNVSTDTSPVVGEEYFEAMMKAFETNIWTTSRCTDRTTPSASDDHETRRGTSSGYGIATHRLDQLRHSVANNGYRGYLEDRRPNAQGEHYLAPQMMPTIACVRRPARSPQRRNVTRGNEKRGDRSALTRIKTSRWTPEPPGTPFQSERQAPRMPSCISPDEDDVAGEAKASSVF